MVGYLSGYAAGTLGSSNGIAWSWGSTGWFPVAVLPIRGVRVRPVWRERWSLDVDKGGSPSLITQADRRKELRASINVE